MTFLRRALAVGFAASMALVGPLAVTQPATADLVASPLSSPADDASAAAAEYVIGQLVTESTGRSLGSDPGGTADAINLLLTDGEHAEVAELVTWLETQVAAIDNPTLAAKVAVALHQGDGDEAAITQLIDFVLAAMEPDGAVGWPSAFTQSWPIIALAVTGNDVPQEMLDNLFTHQGESGMFGGPDFETDEWADDPDGTAMALLAMVAVRDNPGTLDTTQLNEQLPRVVTAAQNAMEPAGYWESFAPTNTTGLLAFALSQTGVDITDSAVWMRSQQQSDGSLAIGEGDASTNMLATLQGGLILGYDGPSGDDASAACLADDNVWVVVQSPDWVTTGCATEFGTGEEALTSAGMAIEHNASGMICQINNFPATCDAAPMPYWAYSHAVAGGPWETAVIGADERTPPAGSIEGWRFGTGEAPEVIVASGEQPTSNESADEGSPMGLYLTIGGVVVAAIAVAGVLFWRRKSTK